MVAFNIISSIFILRSAHLTQHRLLSSTICSTTTTNEYTTSHSNRYEFNNHLSKMQRAGNNSAIAMEVMTTIGLYNNSDNNKYFRQNRQYETSVDRVSCNICIKALLNIGKADDVDRLLQHMNQNNIQIGADTVNILLSHSFKTNSNHATIDDIFDKYFNNINKDNSHSYTHNNDQSELQPTVRTLNTMIDGYRNIGNLTQVLKYFSLFEKYKLQPDMYTYSTLVRTFDTVDGILRVVNRAKNEKCLSGPLLRCAIESLGKLGAPTEALFVQRLRPLKITESMTSSLLISNNSTSSTTMYRNTADIDALVTALLSDASANVLINKSDMIATTEGEEPEGSLPMSLSLHGLTGAEAAFSLVLGSGPGIDIAMAQNESIGNFGVDRGNTRSQSSSPHSQTMSTMLRCGPKGLCVLLTHLQRLIRPPTATYSSSSSSSSQQQQPVQTTSKQESSPTTATTTTTTTVSGQKIRVLGMGELSLGECRDLLWSRAAAAADCTTENVVNGRICDSLIRCYGDDIEGAKAFWTRELLPRARRTETISPAAGLFTETAEKALEALMYVAGLALRPDIGLEIASTVRKRKWSLEQREKIAKSYSIGKRSALQSKTYLNKKTSFMYGVLDTGLEKSLEAELGVLLQKPKESIGSDKKNKWNSLPKIRVQFSTEDSSKYSKKQ